MASPFRASAGGPTANQPTRGRRGLAASLACPFRFPSAPEVRRFKPIQGLFRGPRSLETHLMQAFGLSGDFPRACNLGQVITGRRARKLTSRKHCYAPAPAPVTLARSNLRPGPIVEEMDTFLTKVPFVPCGLALITASTKALTLPEI